MKIEVLPLVGFEAQNALATFSKLLIGLKMLPENDGIKYEDFFRSIEEKSEDEQRELLRLAIRVIPLERDEVLALLRFAKDKNGITYTRTNIANLTIEEMFEIMVEVAMEIGRIKITMVSEEEKKKFPTGQLISDPQ